MPIEDIDKLFKRRLNSRKKHAGRSVMRHKPGAKVWFCLQI